MSRRFRKMFVSLLTFCSFVLILVQPASFAAAQEGSGMQPCALPAAEIAGQGGLRVGALALRPGSLALRPGALALTPGALALTPGALALTPGALALRPGALSEEDEAVIQALVQEILNNAVNAQWLIDLMPSVSGGYEFGVKPVAIIIAD